MVKYVDLSAGTAAWTSDNTSVATVDASSGTVTGVAAGTANISYTVIIGGCNVVSETKQVTVNPAPAYICTGGTAATGITSTTPIPSATGGTISITPDGNYKIHTFTSNGTFTVPGGFYSTVNVLVVAGGGGGGQVIAGGGGGGGVIYNSSYAVSAQTYPVTIGAGGAGAAGDCNYGNGGGGAGGNSAFSSLTAIGGGGGGSFNSTNGYSSGGSGGGIGAGTGFGAISGTSGQGNSGGTSSGNGNNGAGGGGAGNVGGNSVNGSSGAGGSGLASSISGTLAYYGGGGGGGTRSGNGAGGNGGTGDGGAGGVSSTGTAGAANTGGGGGGGGYNGNCYAGGAGGSGIIIIRYPFIPTGVWTSSNTAVATVDSLGNVTGVSSGTSTITYTITNGSCTSVQTALITVNSSTAGTVSATDNGVCVGNSTSLTLTGNSGTGIQWQQSSDGSTGWANVTGGSVGGTTTTYITPWVCRQQPITEYQQAEPAALIQIQFQLSLIHNPQLLL